jgi:hypothetical protein
MGDYGSLRRCECGTLNNSFVNPDRCYDCGTPWREQEAR